ncbi:MULTISPECIES: hypothetical protein [Actinomycetes]|uniref:hypothetical protein n=1 Tax=Actinomycetes TaxID=1760 RepID=UPI0002E6D675|nr:MULTISPECIES: hypothetical protein [Actinomycetes]
MYYTSQPIEMTDRDLLLGTLKAIDAENTLMYSSDWPHWDFDTPGRIMSIEGISEHAKENILGGTGVARLRQAGRRAEGRTVVKRGEQRRRIR